MHQWLVVFRMKNFYIYDDQIRFLRKRADYEYLGIKNGDWTSILGSDGYTLIP